MAKSKGFGLKAVKYTPENPMREGGDGVDEPGAYKGKTRPGGVGDTISKGNKALHPHWRSGGRKAQAKRMYANAKTAHAHTKVRP